MAHQQKRFMSNEELARYMKDRKTFHKALLKNSYFMSSEDDPFTTVKLMKDIYLEKVYFPLCQDIKVRACAHPPKAK